MNDRERRQRQADEKSMDLRSSMKTFRRNERIKLVLWVIAIAVALRYVPWHSLKVSAEQHLGVELNDSDAGTP